ncbi:hypothetical protein ACFC58_11025 [Kitasatospora purpeofusca]|uniref:hypothetical protein n=1 Tax=Kitasatospora purpeofusca TaxID=67352 RepID=UPI0035D86402
MTDSATPQDTAAPAEGPVLPEEAHGPAVEETGPAVGESAAATPEDGERTALRARRRRAAVRWGAAVAVCALAGTGTALAVTAQERTDLPGLATPKDGRYTFPALTLPQLPSGKAVPKENTNRHAAPLRGLLLPVPVEAGGSLTPSAAPAAGGRGSASPSPSPSAPATESATPSGTPSASGTPLAGGAEDRVACDAVAAEWSDPGVLRALLLQHACRDATVREWTAADGTRTQIRLLSFGSRAEAWPLFDRLQTRGALKDAPALEHGDTTGWDAVPGVELAVRELSGAPSGTRVALLSAGDVTGVITMTNPKGVPTAAFRQVVTLQSDLLA